MRLRTSRIIAAIVLLAPMALPAHGQDREPPWTDFLVEVSYAFRQDPPVRLVEKRAELKEALEDATDEERKDFERELNRVEERIDRDTGYIVLGWAVKVDRRQQQVDSTISMAGFFVRGERRSNKLLAEIEPESFLLLGRPGMKDLFTCGGRRYYKIRRVRPAERPNGWRAPKVSAAPPPATPDAASKAEVSISFQKEKEVEGGHIYRHSLKINVTDAPAAARSVKLALLVRAKTTRGETVGPVLVLVDLDRSESGAFSIYRSWEIRLPARVTIDPKETSVVVHAIEFSPPG